jgi:thymidine phosphorylase
VVGERVQTGDTILEVHYRDEPTFGAALSRLREAIAVGDQPPTLADLILEEVRMAG